MTLTELRAELAALNEELVRLNAFQIRFMDRIASFMGRIEVYTEALGRSAAAAGDDSTSLPRSSAHGSTRLQ